jgi:hypothetical protein
VARRQRGKSLKVRLRDVDRGYKKLLKRLGVKARKARRSTTRATKSGTKAIKGIFKEARAEIKRLQKKKPTARQMDASVVTVGIHEEQGAATHQQEDNFGEGFGQASPPTIAEVGAFHEFGLGVPQRSFIRAWADENDGVNKKRLRKIADAVVSGHISSPRQGLERFGLLAVGEIQRRMADGIEPALDERTVKQKGSSVPLIDTGQLRSSITHRVERKAAQGTGDEE